MIARNEGKLNYLIGGEESYGYSIGDFVRDKDAVGASCMIAEIAAVCQSKNISMYEYLLNIYHQLGLYREDLISITKKGKSGSEEIAEIMENLRNNTPDEINGQKVIQKYDYKKQLIDDFDTGSQTKIELPVSNVVQLRLLDGSLITARPSGTEPENQILFFAQRRVGSPQLCHF